MYVVTYLMHYVYSDKKELAIFLCNCVPLVNVWKNNATTNMQKCVTLPTMKWF